MTKYGKIKNKELKQQWLKDLRSGNYKQTKGSLCDRGTKTCKAKYCCLGVLGRSIQKLDAFPIIFKDAVISYKGTSHSKILPGDLINELGLNYRVIGQLTYLNDTENRSFKEIADWVEKNL